MVVSAIFSRKYCILLGFTLHWLWICNILLAVLGFASSWLKGNHELLEWVVNVSSQLIIFSDITANIASDIENMVSVHNCQVFWSTAEREGRKKHLIFENLSRPRSLFWDLKAISSLGFTLTILGLKFSAGFWHRQKTALPFKQDSLVESFPGLC